MSVGIQIEMSVGDGAKIEKAAEKVAAESVTSTGLEPQVPVKIRIGGKIEFAMVAVMSGGT